MIFNWTDFGPGVKDLSNRWFRQLGNDLSGVKSVYEATMSYRRLDYKDKIE